MFLTVRNAQGHYQSYDLSTWQAWSLELQQSAIKVPGEERPHASIALCIRGPMAGLPLSLKLVEVSTGKNADDVAELAHVLALGLNHGSHQQTRSRVVEAMQVFHNGERFAKGELEKLIDGMGRIVDAYFAFVKGAWGDDGTTVASVGRRASFDGLGWQWWLTDIRFPNLAMSEAGASLMGEIGGIGGLGGAPGGGQAPKPLGPPPGTEVAKNKAPKPITKKPGSSGAPPPLPGDEGGGKGSAAESADAQKDGAQGQGA